MPRIPQPLGVTIVPTHRQRLLSAVFTSTKCILSFDPTTRSLVTYYWSVMHKFAVWQLSMFAQARWREQASETWRAAQLSQNPWVPWTMLPMPAADAAQWRGPLYRSSHVHTDIWTLRWRVCGWVCQESLRLYRLVLILAQDIQKLPTYHRWPVPLERMYSKVGVPVRIFPTRGQLPGCLWC